MSTYRFANNAATTLGSATTPTATSITVASGTGAKFPQPGAGQYFTATIFASATGLPNEIVRVTSRNGDTMTVQRGQEGSTAQSWSVGDTFSNFVTAGFLNQLVDSGSLQEQDGNFAIDAGTADAGSINLVPVPVSYAALLGVPIRVKKQNATSTGAYTLNVNGMGPVAVLLGGALLEGGELTANEIYEVSFDGAQFSLLSPPGAVHGDRITETSIDNSRLALMAAATIKGNLSGGPANPYDVTVADLAAALGIGLVAPGVLNLPGVQVQFGANTTVTNQTGITFSQAFNQPFAAGSTPIVVLMRLDPATGSWRAYNQKNYTLYGLSTNESFTFRLHDTDSADTSAYVYGFNWVAFGVKG